MEAMICEAFSTTCGSASITSIVSKWQPFSFIFNQENREKQVDGECQYKFFVSNPIDIKESDEHALDSALHLSCLFGLGKFGLSMYSSCFHP
jgi:hypothetical protein